MEGCPAFDAGSAYAPTLISAIDCNTAQLAQLGFGALSTTGSPAVTTIAGLLTLLVALFGYRLILGGIPDLSETVVTIFKVGLVLAFATQWPAFETVFYNAAINGPAELLAKLPLGDAENRENLATRLQGSYDALASLELPPHAGSVLKPAAGQPDTFARAALPSTAETSYGNFLSFRPMSAGMFVLFSGLFSLALPRLIAGLMLALGPIFIGFLLFDATRSVFFGWVRALAWSVVATVLVSIILQIELSVVESQISLLIGEFAAGESGLATMGELIATSLLFALLAVGGMIAAIAPTRIRAIVLRLRPTISMPRSADPVLSPDKDGLLHNQPEILPSRAQALGDRLAIIAAGESRAGQTNRGNGRERQIERLPSNQHQVAATPLGQSYRAPVGPKRSAIPLRRAEKK